MSSLLAADPVADAKKVSQESASRLQQREESLRTFERRTKLRLREHRQRGQRESAERPVEASIVEPQPTPFEAAILRINETAESVRRILSNT